MISGAPIGSGTTAANPSLMLISVMVYAIGQHAEERRFAAFHPVYLILAAGVSASFITGDLFNLFVAIRHSFTRHRP